MAKIKAKIIGYDVPERGPMVKLQIKEPLKEIELVNSIDVLYIT